MNFKLLSSALLLSLVTGDKFIIQNERAMYNPRETSQSIRNEFPICSSLDDFSKLNVAARAAHRPDYTLSRKFYSSLILKASTSLAVLYLQEEVNADIMGISPADILKTLFNGVLTSLRIPLGVVQSVLTSVSYEKLSPVFIMENCSSSIVFQGITINLQF
jgi:hypothetical protein